MTVEEGNLTWTRYTTPNCVTPVSHPHSKVTVPMQRE